jgi:single-stranded-DNA-specific exonuclease
MASLEERLLNHYHLTPEGYACLSAAPSFSALPPLQGAAVEKALARLQQAKAAGEKVLIYGDYDADGIMSASILLKSFKAFGLKAEGYLPSRYLDGYGLTKANVDKIAQSGFSLIVACDNGVTAFEALAEAKTRGLDVLILDHHEIDPLHLPECLSLIHPSTLRYGEVPVSAGYLSFLFATALLGREDDYLLTLGGLSTLSDMMPLRSYNRDLVRLALSALRENKYPEITALSEKSFLDENVLSMEIIPKINAVGRLEKGNAINRLLHYFTDPESPQKAIISQWLEDMNEQRKEATKIAAAKISIDPSEEAIVVQADVPEGLNGLLANRLLGEYAKPVAVFSPMEKDPSLLVGSLRSKEGFDILKALSGIKAPLIGGGGHSFAGGVAIRKEDFGAFKKDFLFAALKHKLEPKREEYLSLDFSECTMKSYELIRTFGPFGMDWPAPKFLLKDLEVSAFSYLKNGLYLSTDLRPGVRLFSFALGAASFEDQKKVSLAVAFSLHEYKGRQSLDLLAEKAL